MPIAGFRNEEGLAGQEEYANYWSSSPISVSINVWNLRFYSYAVHPRYYDTRADGSSVRCFSNDYMFTSPSMTIHPNG